MIPPICCMMNVYAELPCFWVDYSIENCCPQAPFVRQKMPEKSMKIRVLSIFLQRVMVAVIRRRILVVENAYFAGKQRKRRTKICNKKEPVRLFLSYLFAFLSAILSVRAANSSRPSASPRIRSSQPRLWMISVSSSLVKPRLPRLNRQFINVFLR